ncbi:MAG: c-type cytochrome [Bauldia sp.]
MRPRHLLPALALALTTVAAAAEDMASEVDRGGRLLHVNCGACHATETDDDSLNATAPPFRDVARRYPPEDLGEALAEGIVTGHPGMPEAVFEPDEVAAIIAYLDWLRTR